MIREHGRDWRGGVAVAIAMERKRNPGKRLKNGLLAIFVPGFSCENPRAYTQTFDAPSMALLVEQNKKWQDVLKKNICMTKQVPQNKEEIKFDSTYISR